MALYVGTAGYVYPHWRKGVFYPAGLRQEQELQHYFTNFPVVEINATFYGFPRAKTLEKWALSTQPGSLLALKAPASITHKNRLRSVSDDVRDFIKIAARSLGNKLGPLLFQCPPSLSFSMSLLKDFLADVVAAKEACEWPVRVALEFRNAEWFCDDVFNALASHDVALVNNVAVLDSDFSHVDDSAYPRFRDEGQLRPAAWSYTRFHGSKNPGVSTDFPDSVLASFAEKSAISVRAKGQDDFVIFLNDLEGIAPQNAQRFAELVAVQCSIRSSELFHGFVPRWAQKGKSINEFFVSPGEKTSKLNQERVEKDASKLLEANLKLSSSSKVSKRGKVQRAPTLNEGNAKPNRTPPRKKVDSRSLITSYFTKKG